MTAANRRSLAIETDLGAAIELVASFRELAHPERSPELPLDCGTGMILPALCFMVHQFNEASDAPYAEFPANKRHLNSAELVHGVISMMKMREFFPVWFDPQLAPEIRESPASIAADLANHAIHESGIVNIELPCEFETRRALSFPQGIAHHLAVILQAICLTQGAEADQAVQAFASLDGSSALFSMLNSRATASEYLRFRVASLVHFAMERVPPVVKLLKHLVAGGVMQQLHGITQHSSNTSVRQSAVGTLTALGEFQNGKLVKKAAARSMVPELVHAITAPSASKTQRLDNLTLLCTQMQSSDRVASDFISLPSNITAFVAYLTAQQPRTAAAAAADRCRPELAHEDELFLTLNTMHSAVLGSAERQHAVGMHAPGLMAHLVRIVGDEAHSALVRFMAMEVVNDLCTRAALPCDQFVAANGFAVAFATFHRHFDELIRGTLARTPLPEVVDEEVRHQLWSHPLLCMVSVCGTHGRMPERDDELRAQFFQVFQKLAHVLVSKRSDLCMHDGMGLINFINITLMMQFESPARTLQWILDCCVTRLLPGKLPFLTVYFEIPDNSSPLKVLTGPKAQHLIQFVLETSRRVSATIKMLSKHIGELPPVYAQHLQWVQAKMMMGPGMLSRMGFDGGADRSDDDSGDDKTAAARSMDPARFCSNGGCLQHLNLKLCARCKKTKYCSAQCQKEHWKTHKQQCVSQ
jgi:hypothetical protein